MKSTSNRYRIDVELRRLFDFVDKIWEVKNCFYSSTKKSTCHFALGYRYRPIPHENAVLCAKCDVTALALSWWKVVKCCDITFCTHRTTFLWNTGTSIETHATTYMKSQGEALNFMSLSQDSPGNPGVPSAWVESLLIGSENQFQVPRQSFVSWSRRIPTGVTLEPAEPSQRSQKTFRFNTRLEKFGQGGERWVGLGGWWGGGAPPPTRPSKVLVGEYIKQKA